MKEDFRETHDGKVVSVAGDKLTTTCSEGKQHCHTMAKDAKVTCDGQASKAADLKAGTLRPGDHAQRRQERRDGRRIRKAHSGRRESVTAYSSGVRERPVLLTCKIFACAKK